MVTRSEQVLSQPKHQNTGRGRCVSIHTHHHTYTEAQKWWLNSITLVYVHVLFFSKILLTPPLNNLSLFEWRCILSCINIENINTISHLWRTNFRLHICSPVVRAEWQVTQTRASFLSMYMSLHFRLQQVAQNTLKTHGSRDRKMFVICTTFQWWARLMQTNSPDDFILTEDFLKVKNWK